MHVSFTCFTSLRAGFPLGKDPSRYIGIMEQASGKNDAKCDAKLCILSLAVTFCTLKTFSGPDIADKVVDNFIPLIIDYSCAQFLAENQKLWAFF